MTDIVDRVIDAVRPRYTRTPEAALERTISLTLEAIDNGIPGDLVECGVWKGGCSFAMLLAQRYAYGEIRRPVWMYDSFEGMSPPSPEDGPIAALWWEAAKDLPKDKANEAYCIAPFSNLLAGIEELDLGHYVNIRQGWLQDTLLNGPAPLQIAVLRIDCDWYEPVLQCLYLIPKVSPGGSIIIDDYDAWEGARAATHKYLSTHNLPWEIRPIAGGNGAWMTKAAA